MQRLIDGQKLLKAIVGAQNMADIYNEPAVRKCLDQLSKKIQAGNFDAKETK